MNLLISIMILVGAGFICIAALGLVRFPDFYSRMHAVTKAGAFGGTILLLATALLFQSLEVSLMIAVNILFFYFTAPIAGHMIARSAYINRVKQWYIAEVDELKDHLKTKDDK